jgi:hypothetical protein
MAMEGGVATAQEYLWPSCSPSARCGSSTSCRSSSCSRGWCAAAGLVRLRLGGRARDHAGPHGLGDLRRVLRPLRLFLRRLCLRPERLPPRDLDAHPSQDGAGLPGLWALVNGVLVFTPAPEALAFLIPPAARRRAARAASPNCPSCRCCSVWRARWRWWPSPRWWRPGLGGLAVLARRPFDRGLSRLLPADGGDARRAGAHGHRHGYRAGGADGHASPASSGRCCSISRSRRRAGAASCSSGPDWAWIDKTGRTRPAAAQPAQ